LKPYHYVDFSHARHWYEVSTGDATVDSIIDRIAQDEGYTAVMDNPAADIYLDFFQKFPNAKVILTVRDTPQQFAKSWKVLYESVVQVTEREFSLNFPSFFQWIPDFWYLKRMRCMMGTTHLRLPACHLLKHWDQYPEGWIEEQYTRHNQHVLDHIPADQLLVFNVKEGWEPLCKFLDKPIPEHHPFPHVQINSAAGLLEMKQTLVMVVWLWIPVLTLIVVVILWACCLRPKKRGKGSQKDE